MHRLANTPDTGIYNLVINLNNLFIDHWFVYICNYLVTFNMPYCFSCKFSWKNSVFKTKCVLFFNCFHQLTFFLIEIIFEFLLPPTTKYFHFFVSLNRCSMFRQTLCNYGLNIKKYYHLKFFSSKRVIFPTSFWNHDYTHWNTTNAI